MISKKIIILLILILMSIIVFRDNLPILMNNSNTNIVTGYYNDNCSYIFDKSDSEITSVWIPGGGLSSFTFAFSGVGPFTIQNNYLVKNRYKLSTQQLFIDVGGRGFSTGKYPTTDIEIVDLYIKCIKFFNLKKIILIGVSYGGKLAIMISKKLPSDIIITVIGITPFYDPIHSMAFIPEPGIRLGKYIMTSREKELYEQYKTDFIQAVSNKNHIKALKYMDDTGKFSKLTETLLYNINTINPIYEVLSTLGINYKSNKLNIQKYLNMWNINKPKQHTLGDWIIPNMLDKINKFLKKAYEYDFMKPLYSSDNKGYNSFLKTSKYMINSNAWRRLAWTNNTYIRGVDITNLDSSLITITGGADVITSYDGLLNLWKKNNKGFRKFINFSTTLYKDNKSKNYHNLYNISGGSHLLVMNHGMEIQTIIHTLI